MRKFNRFGRGGCFTCLDCGRRTRETAANAGLDNLCGLCAELAMLQNGISDNGSDSDLGREYIAESKDLLVAIVKAGGKLNDGMTWAEEPEPSPEPKAAPCGHWTCRMEGPCQGPYSDNDCCPRCATDWKRRCDCEIPPGRLSVGG